MKNGAVAAWHQGITTVNGSELRGRVKAAGPWPHVLYSQRGAEETALVNST